MDDANLQDGAACSCTTRSHRRQRAVSAFDGVRCLIIELN